MEHMSSPVRFRSSRKGMSTTLRHLHLYTTLTSPIYWHYIGSFYSINCSASGATTTTGYNIPAGIYICEMHLFIRTFVSYLYCVFYHLATVRVIPVLTWTCVWPIHVIAYWTLCRYKVLHIFILIHWIYSVAFYLFFLTNSTICYYLYPKKLQLSQKRR